MRTLAIEPLDAGLQAVLFAISALWMLTVLATTWSTLMYFRGARRRGKLPKPPSCIVLSPVKGVSPALGGFAEALLSQDYADYEVVFVVESADDPAFQPLCAVVQASRGRAKLIIAGAARNCGQKAHNLAIALRAVQPAHAIVAFIDADVVPPVDWLTQLTRRIAQGLCDIATGYFIMTPRSTGTANFSAALISLDLATLHVPPGFRLCFGGSMAFRRTTLETLQPEELLMRTLSDDLSLSRAASRHGVGIHMSHAARAPKPVEHSWRSLMSYLRRQYQIVRIHAPLHWAAAGWGLLLPPLGIAAAAVLALSGQVAIVAIPIAVWILQQVRFILQHRALRRILDDAALESLEPVFRISHLVGPLAEIPHLLAFLTSAYGGTIRWAGITYKVSGPEQVEILSREETS